MIDRNQVEKLIIEVAAKDILPYFRKLKSYEIREKNKNDPVTIADEAAEVSLTHGLKKIDPDSSIVGEEGVASDPNILGELQNKDKVWLVDPIDGTANYARGKEIFGTMVAYLVQREIVGGWIYFPIWQEMFACTKGSGVFQNGKQLSARGNVDRPYRGIVSGIPRQAESRKKTSEQRKAFQIERSFRCSAMHYRLLILGQIDFLLSFDTYPWDHAPGIALAREMGGAANIDFGQRLPEGSERHSYILSAASQKIWDEVHEKLL